MACSRVNFTFTDFLTGHDGSYDLSSVLISGLLAAAPLQKCTVWHYERTARSLITFPPSPIFKVDLDNADRHVMSRSYRIMKKGGHLVTYFLRLWLQHDKRSEII